LTFGGVIVSQEGGQIRSQEKNIGDDTGGSSSEEESEAETVDIN